MALIHTPLDPTTLTEGQQKVVSGPARMMAARGLVPLPRPADLLVVLYVLAQDGDASVAQTAQKTAAELPEKLLAPGLADVALDPRVLDFFASRAIGKGAAEEALLLNRTVADETIKTLCARLGEKALELVAQNEQRLLRTPAIIGALYLNPKARMSTVDRAVELAVRNKVTVPGIPAWDDVVAAVLGAAQTELSPEVRAAADAAADAAFASVSSFAIGDAAIDDALLEELLGDEDSPTAPPLSDAAREEKKQQISKLTIPQKIRLATLGNAFARATLIRDTNRQVAMAAVKSPGCTDNEIVKYASNRGLSSEVIMAIANDKNWTRIYQVKMALITNPKTQLAVAMRLLPFLHDKDQAKIAKSKGIANALAVQAKKLVTAKQGR